MSPILYRARGRVHAAALAFFVTAVVILAGCASTSYTSQSSEAFSTKSALHADLAVVEESANHAKSAIAETTPATSIYRTATVLPTYPTEAYESDQIDPAYRWPYVRFDREQFLLDDPPPENRAYELIVMENEFLRLFILPELGGRIWQVVHKPTGQVIFYQNSVVKPSPWGPANQLGWTGLGGLEWNLPVVEHGYDWGTSWNVSTLVDEDGTGVARLSTPNDGRYLAASIDVTLPPEAAYFEIEPHIQNHSDEPLEFDYWHNAMLAPGTGRSPSSELRFLLPGEAVRIHSTGDERLPGPNSVIPWPRYRARDLSRLGEWDQYLGFFEYPAAQGPFAGVYEPAADTGAVRIFPADVARGSKVFGLGWNDALRTDYYTDDGSAYVELHGGLSPTFADRATLGAGESVQWRERWFPVQGIGPFTAADEAGALTVQIDDAEADVVSVAFYPSASFTGDVVVTTWTERELARQPLVAEPGAPVHTQLDLMRTGQSKADGAILTVSLEDPRGEVVISSTVQSP